MAIAPSRSQVDGPQGGYYISCADIAITQNGLLPLPSVYASLPRETGELPVNQPRKGYPCVPPSSAAADPMMLGTVLVGIVLVLLLALGVYCKFCRGGGSKGGASSTTGKYEGSTPAPPPPPPGPPAAPGLPPGWNAAVDPASGNMYYATPVSGETSWQKPVATQAPVPPPPPPGPPPGAQPEILPPGWSAAVDPASGDIYYANPVSGETSWEKPGARV